MENLLKEKFERLVIDAPKDGIGNAKGMMKYITDLMQSAYELAKSEYAEKIEVQGKQIIQYQVRQRLLDENLQSMQQTNDAMAKRLMAVQDALNANETSVKTLVNIHLILNPPKQ